jgi:hypothetical protein
MSIVDKILAEDRIYETLSSALIGRTKKTTNRGFTFFNCPVCIQRGQPRADTRNRCGVIYDSEGIGIHCFNCGAKLRYKKGQLLSKGMEQFLVALGVPEKKVQELYFWAWELQRILRDSSFEINEQNPTFFHAGFPTVALPDNARPILELAEEGCIADDFIAVVEYLLSRGEDLKDATSYHWSPSTKNHMHRRLIVPFYYDDRIVGWTARAIDENIKPKYFNNSPNGYLFNCNVMNMDRKYLILTEGIFDALSIDGVALQTNDLNDKKISWINATKQTKILVPDRDEAGAKLIDIALKEGWNVAMPFGTGSKDSQWWEHDIKDVADAVKRYGKLWTLRSIISSSTNNEAKVNLARKKIKASHRTYNFLNDGE